MPSLLCMDFGSCVAVAFNEPLVCRDGVCLSEVCALCVQQSISLRSLSSLLFTVVVCVFVRRSRQKQTKVTCGKPTVSLWYRTLADRLFHPSQNTTEVPTKHARYSLCGQIFHTLVMRLLGV